MLNRDMHIKEWDVLTLKCVRILQGHTKEITCIDVSLNKICNYNATYCFLVIFLEFSTKL